MQTTLLIFIICKHLNQVIQEMTHWRLGVHVGKKYIRNYNHTTYIRPINDDLVIGETRQFKFE